MAQSMTCTAISGRVQPFKKKGKKRKRRSSTKYSPKVAQKIDKIVRKRKYSALHDGMKKHISVGVHLHKHGGTAIRGSSEWLPRRCRDVVEYTYDGPIGGGEIYGCDAGKRLFKLRDWIFEVKRLPSESKV